MSPAEIKGRCIDQWHVLQERLVVETGIVPDSSSVAGLDGRRTKTLFNEFLYLPFYFAVPSEPKSTNVRSFRSLFPDRIDSILEDAREICLGTVRLLGKKVHFPSGRIDDHLDWATGDHFPMQFYRSVGVEDVSGAADLKRVWETNRHQFLMTLGKAYWISGDESYADKIVRTMEDWIDFNPIYRGTNWKESLELAFRLLSWTWSLRLIADSEALTDRALQKILTSIAWQRDHIARHLSFYYSPNTHLLGEAFALFVVGLAFPELGSDGVTPRDALQILETELSRQVAQDGSDREQSAYYHCYALDIFLLTTIHGKQHDISFNSAWMTRVERMAEFLLAIVRPDGSLARFGDDDGGRTLRLDEENYYRPNSLLATAAVLFNRADFKVGPSRDVPEEIFWLFGTEGVTRFHNLPKGEPSRSLAWFPDAEIAVQRTGPGPQDGWLISTGQPMGILGSGHSHAGLLSFELVLAGVPVIVDPGTCTYEASGPWRDIFRSAGMHNTVQIDDSRLYLPAGPFRWSKAVSVQTSGLRTPDFNTVQLGYQVGNAGVWSVRHWRSYSLESSDSARIYDRFDGTGRHKLSFSLQFAPGVHLQRKSGVEFEINIGAFEGSITLEGFKNFRLTESVGKEGSKLGWYSPQYGEKIPATTLCIEEEADFPTQRSFHIALERTGKPHGAVFPSSFRSSGE
jgi:heparinase II/III-like protein